MRNFNKLSTGLLLLGLMAGWSLQAAAKPNILILAAHVGHLLATDIGQLLDLRNRVDQYIHPYLA